MSKVYIKSIVVIVCICLIMGLLLAGVYKITEPIIETNEANAARAALEEMFPEANDFTELSISDAPSCVTSVYQVDDGRYCVVYLAISTAYTSGTTTLIMGVDTSTMTITALNFLSYNESVDCGKDYPASYTGQTAELVDVDASASPAVYTRAAVKQAVTEALNYLGQVQ